MARKKSKGTSSKAANSETGKVSVQLRLDAELHERLKAAAAEAEVSVNQLIQGMCWGCVSHLIQGEPVWEGDPRYEESGILRREELKGCMFFGTLGMTREEVAVGLQEELEEAVHPEDVQASPGEFWFRLDFSPRGAVRTGVGSWKYSPRPEAGSLSDRDRR